jgi:hypothetical protein
VQCHIMQHNQTTYLCTWVFPKYIHLGMKLEGWLKMTFYTSNQKVKSRKLNFGLTDYTSVYCHSHAHKIRIKLSNFLTS